MSAFVCSDYHISYIVEGGVRYKAWVNMGTGHNYLTSDKAQHAYEVLKRENIRSVNHRYQTNASERMGLRKYVSHVDPVYVLKAIACLEYQSCEHEGWEKSLAHTICQAIKESAIRALPDYDSIPWGLSPEKEVRS